jgi:hypothetical protein
MQNFTLNDKLALQALIEGGQQVSFVSYDPTVTAPSALDPIWVEYYREDTVNLVEIIYVTGAVAPVFLYADDAGTILVADDGITTIEG